MLSLVRIRSVIALVALLLQLPQTGQAQLIGGFGDCKCVKTVVLSQDQIVNMFLRIIETSRCSDAITEFKFAKGYICGQTKDAWVQQIISCIRKDPTPCKKPAIKPAPVTTRFTPTSTSGTPPNVLSSTTSLSTTEPLRLAETVASTTSTTTEPLHITGIYTNSAPSIASRVTKSTIDSATENGAGEHLHDLQNTPTTAADKTKHQTIAIISLLAVVFFLVGLVAFLICRRRRAKQQSYEAVATKIPENGVVE